MSGILSSMKKLLVLKSERPVSATEVRRISYISCPYLFAYELYISISFFLGSKSKNFAALKCGF